MATRERIDQSGIDRSSAEGPAADDAIGGYFGLEIPQARQPFYPDALRFQSATAALRAFLDHLRPSRLWMPRYICPPLVDSVRASGVRVAHYALEDDMRVCRALDHGPNDAILCVDYFGVSSRAVDDAISRFGAARVIVDAAQALFRRRNHELAVIYSPRKFVGLPDGGLLATNRSVPTPVPQDEGSLARTAHLLLRLGHEVEEGYEEFRNAEASLMGQLPKRMSRLTSRLLDSIDLARVARRRRMNYAVLSERLANTGEYTFPLPEGCGSALLRGRWRGRRRSPQKALRTAHIFASLLDRSARARTVERMGTTPVQSHRFPPLRSALWPRRDDPAGRRVQ